MNANSPRSCLCHGSYVLACACLMILSGCKQSRSPETASTSLAETSDETHFDRLFQTNCAGCHGADGKLGPAPPLNDPVFLAIVPEEELARVIENGRRGTPMPAFAKAAGGSLEPAQVRSLTAGIKRYWKQVDAPPGSLPAYPLPGTQDHAASDSVEASEAGAKVFARACAPCHGPDGKGNSDDPLPNAIHDASFLSLVSDQALRRIIITGRPDLGMPSFSEKAGRSADFQPLDEQEIAHLGALLAEWRGPGAAAGTDASNP